MISVILDNLSAYKGKKIKAWCAKNNVELCFSPTYSSWANPIECHFGPLRDFVLNNSDHPNHTVLTGLLHAYLAERQCQRPGHARPAATRAGPASLRAPASLGPTSTPTGRRSRRLSRLLSELDANLVRRAFTGDGAPPSRPPDHS